MSANDFFEQLKADLAEAGNPERAEKMAAYMRHQFAFYGVPAPARKAIVKHARNNYGLPPMEEWQHLARHCFELGEARELTYALGDLLIPRKKKLTANWLPLLEELIVSSAWWDTVDWLGPHLATAAMNTVPEQIPLITGRWIASDNIWLQRSAIIFQLHAKQATREDLLFGYVLRRADSKEFFVQKGAGWALRQYSKTKPEMVRAFIDENEEKLAPLTVREGRKILLKSL